jgi:hypothetical protein
LDFNSHITSLFGYTAKLRECVPTGLDEAITFVVSGDSVDSTTETRLALKDRYLWWITVFVAKGMRDRYTGNAAP